MKKYKSTSEWDNPKNSPVLTKHPGVGKREYPTKDKVSQAGHELKVNPPSVLKHTEKKFGKAQARRQKVAIMLAKSRKGK